jgi:flagellin
LLQDVRQKLTELSNEGTTTSQRTILRNDFNQLLSQAANFVANAVFNNVNILESGATNVNTLSNINGGTMILRARNLRATIISLAGAISTSATNAQSVINNQFTNMESIVNIALGELGADTRALNFQTEFMSTVLDRSPAPTFLPCPGPLIE